MAIGTNEGYRYRLRTANGLLKSEVPLIGVRHAQAWFHRHERRGRIDAEPWWLLRVSRQRYLHIGEPLRRDEGEGALEQVRYCSESEVVNHSGAATDRRFPPRTLADLIRYADPGGSFARPTPPERRSRWRNSSVDD